MCKKLTLCCDSIYPGCDARATIFSGDYSRDMWSAINEIKTKEIRDALYLLGCRLQELEAQIHKAQKEG